MLNNSYPLKKLSHLILFNEPQNIFKCSLESFKCSAKHKCEVFTAEDDST